MTGVGPLRHVMRDSDDRGTLVSRSTDSSQPGARPIRRRFERRQRQRMLATVPATATATAVTAPGGRP